MDSKTDDAIGSTQSSGSGTGHLPGPAKRVGPPSPPPPPPLQPMKLPPTPKAKSGSDPASAGITGAEASMAEHLASKVVDDGDIIEKEWVEKARKIAEAYRNDPYRQSEELNILRANYMERRYGKTIKLSK